MNETELSKELQHYQIEPPVWMCFLGITTYEELAEVVEYGPRTILSDDSNISIETMSQHGEDVIHYALVHKKLAHPIYAEDWKTICKIYLSLAVHAWCQATLPTLQQKREGHNND